MTQELPQWVQDKNRQRAKPTPADVAKAKKKSALAPKAEPKPKPTGLHVRVVFSGSMEFDLEGEQANDLWLLLDRGADADEIISTLDPWTSGGSIKQHVTILEDPPSPGDSYNRWFVDEGRGTVENGTSRDSSGGPFYYTLDSDKPFRVAWAQVPLTDSWPSTYWPLGAS